MPYSTDRLIVTDSHGNPLGDIPPSALAGRPRAVEEVNGEHTLTIVTIGPCAMLEKGSRILWQDGMGTWHEWVVDEVHEDHDYGEYLCIWSLQADNDADDTEERWVSAQEGAHDPVAASVALDIALSDSTLWEPGTVTVATTGACSLYDQQVWANIKKVAEKFHGELAAEITVGSGGVTSRRVALLAHVGKTEATRRFDYGRDLVGIERTEAPGPRWCGIRPRGGSAKTDSDGVDYSARIGIEAYAGSPYIYDDEVDEETGVSVKELNKVPDGHGGWSYPCKTVIYDQDVEGVTDQYALAQELYEMASADLITHTRPNVAYSADVLQLAQGGFDPKGVAEGDEIHIVDRTFAGGSGLRVPGRVLRYEHDLPIGGVRSTGPATLEIGQIGRDLADRMREVADSAASRVDARVDAITRGGTIVYAQDLLDRVNAELNSELAYVYIVTGADEGSTPVYGGIFTYDHAVTNPLVGSEATKVIQINGGGIRFANSRKSSGDWDWKNVITADGYIGLAATIAAITSGIIHDANDNVVINLDGGTVTFKQGLIRTADGLSLWDLSTGQMRVYGTDTAVEYGKYRRSGYYSHYDRTDRTSIPAGDTENAYVSRDGVIYSAPRTTAKPLQLTSKMTLADGVITLDRYKQKSEQFTADAHGGLIVDYGADEVESRMTIDAGWSYETANGKILGLTMTRETDHNYAAEGTSEWYDTHDYPALHMTPRHSNQSGPAPYDAGFTIRVGISDYRVKYPPTDMIADGPLRIEGGGYYANGELKYDHWVDIGSNSGTSAVNVRNLTQLSDRRMKDHVAWLDEDAEAACEFARSLRPALFEMSGLLRMGFYAQDVREADLWGTDTVREGVDTDGTIGYDPLTLDYQGLIAPLTAYAQALERRIDGQQETIEALTKRLEALEGRMGTDAPRRRDESEEQ